eukprot:3028860-Pleurochrysis_carterae.AAC.1
MCAQAHLRDICESSVLTTVACKVCTCLYAILENPPVNPITSSTRSSAQVADELHNHRTASHPSCSSTQPSLASTSVSSVITSFCDSVTALSS